MIFKVAIVILAVVAVVAADSYGYDKSYKPSYGHGYDYSVRSPSFIVPNQFSNYLCS